MGSVLRCFGTWFKGSIVFFDLCLLFWCLGSIGSKPFCAIATALFGLCSIVVGWFWDELFSDQPFDPIDLLRKFKINAGFRCFGARVQAGFRCFGGWVVLMSTQVLNAFTKVLAGAIVAVLFGLCSVVVGLFWEELFSDRPFDPIDLLRRLKISVRELFQLFGTYKELKQ
ncbi:unnamed protein product [Arabis nemorensis]|uniref:Uncharacterized protein n=1 Tax=Arabis nemorensis TaxID=586526 RepID=A0A565B5L8_9BRAS|nr:unnamed protein product [Arabis nemorensis]